MQWIYIRGDNLNSVYIFLFVMSNAYLPMTNSVLFILAITDKNLVPGNHYL